MAGEKERRDLQKGEGRKTTVLGGTKDGEKEGGSLGGWRKERAWRALEDS